MADVLTPQQRSRNMAAIRGKNTKPEIIVRRLLHGLGYRYRLHRKDLPGRPDLAFPSRRTAVFVHGCFWHSHTCKYGSVQPATNASFWSDKRAANVARDARQQAALEKAGWSIFVVWECETKNPEPLEAALVRFLDTDRSDRHVVRCTHRR